MIRDQLEIAWLAERAFRAEHGTLPVILAGMKATGEVRAVEQTLHVGKFTVPLDDRGFAWLSKHAVNRRMEEQDMFFTLGDIIEAHLQRIRYALDDARTSVPERDG